MSLSSADPDRNESAGFDLRLYLTDFVDRGMQLRDAIVYLADKANCVGNSASLSFVRGSTTRLSGAVGFFRQRLV